MPFGPKPRRRSVWTAAGRLRRPMPDALTPQEAAARLEPRDTLGIPLGTGQPPAFIAALGERDDWADLRIYGALLLAWSEAFQHPHVHYLSGFFGPVERALRDQGANISFVPADFRRFEPLLEQQAPRVMATVAAPPDDRGWCSLSLHAGGTVQGASPRRRRSGPAAGGRGLAELPAHPRPGARLPARPAPRRDRRARRLGVGAVRAPGAGAGRGRRRDRRARTALSSPTARPCRPGSGRSPRRSSAGSPRATAAITACTRRCSRTGSCACTRRAR